MNNIERNTLLLTKCAIRSIKNEKFSFSDEELNNIYSFSKKHDIAHIVAYGLKINDAIPRNSIGKKFNDAIFNAYFRYQQTCDTARKIFEILESDNIDYLPLKGSVIRSFYPEPWMRTSSDIDILIRETDINKAIESITSKTDFKSDLPGKYDVSLFSEKLHQHIELHFSLLDDRYEEMQKPLIDIWSKAIKDNKNSYSLPEEYFLYYHYAHMAKHFKFMGFGIRLVLDTYIINKNIKYDYTQSNIFKQGNLITFSKAIDNLAEIWFGDKNSNKEFDDLTDYILGSGIYGTAANKVNNINRSKLNYLIYRIFMPYDQMIFSYPILKKYRFLLPFCWFLRFFKFFKKDSAKRSLHEVKANLNSSNNEKEKIKAMLTKYDLPQ